MTSSLRNSIHRRNHKERSQLAHRAKLGVLEKHADYVKRARDYHSKQDRLTRLKQKAAERNKDEFYFSMKREKTKGGVHVKDRGNVALPSDIVKVLKTQDENYVRTMRAAGLKKIDKIKSQLMEMADLLKPTGAASDDEFEEELDDEEYQALLDAGVLSQRPGGKRRKPGHIIFAESSEEAKKLGSKRKRTIEEPSHSEEVQQDLGWASTAPKKKSKKEVVESSPKVNEDAQETQALARESKKRLLKELSARLVRDRSLRYAQREFELQRLMMGKGGRKKIQGVEKVEGGNDEDEEDQDEIDARKGRRPKSSQKVDEKNYKPRVYKWRLERKR
ncbi:hypothetical protein K443DRAFT_87077 [Laccaria amethystina LaAM-08-1]|uniref:U3 small nucleolar RNA-associated protein 11 n=1 Tax=Laccaria amethystina LaAM-08-1 TaxID=1095629 RepID=A0A0C9YHR6_9AGAR|nr:hypothetical protein K443DRAFT_87077 [Laccaria amethystina LaAM-08-1]